MDDDCKMVLKKHLGGGRECEVGGGGLGGAGKDVECEEDAAGGAGGVWEMLPWMGWAIGLRGSAV